MRTRTGNQSDMAKLRRPVNKPTIMDKSLGTLWHPTSNIGRVYLEFFSEFQHCMYPYRVKGGGGGGGGGGGKKTARKFKKGCIVLWGNPEWILHYCPKDFGPWL